MNKLSTFLRESYTARFLIPVGISLIVFGVVMYFINSKNQNYVETTAIITRCELVEEAHTDATGDIVNATYNVYVKYTVDGKEYNTLLGELSKYEVGKEIKIYYNPEDPNQITQTISLMLPMVLVGCGVGALIWGITSGANAIKKHKEMKEQEEGWSNE